MDEISLKGENYVKASILARKFGYTSDYVGQLCRSGQVKATVIGRSWYVNEESLLAHRKGRYRSTLAKSKESVRKLAEERIQPQRTINAQRVVRYENDEESLLPSLREKSMEAAYQTPVFVGPETEIEEEHLMTPEEPESMENTIAIRPIEHRPMPRPRRRPPVRTIPAFTVADIAPRAVEVEVSRERPIATPVRRKRSSMVPALALMGLLLTAEMILIMGVWGVEKQVTVTSAGSGMILYDFEPELVASAFRSIMGSKISP